MDAGLTWLKVDVGVDLVANVPGAVSRPVGQSLSQGERVMHPFTGLELTDKGVALMSEYVGQIREVIGMDVSLSADHFGHIGVNSCIKLAKAMQKWNLAWMEDMVPWQLPNLLKMIKDAVDVPILTGEDIYLKEDFFKLIDMGAVDMIHPDLATVRRDPRDEEDRGLRDGARGPHGDALRGVARSPSWPTSTAPPPPRTSVCLEHHSLDVPWWGDLVTPSPVIEKGFALVPDRPGLGVEPNEEVVKRHLKELRLLPAHPRVGQGALLGPALELSGPTMGGTLRMNESRRRRFVCSTVAVLVLGGSVAVAVAGPPPVAQVDPALFQDLRWRLIGPFRGGRVLAASGVPGEPHHFYFGSVNGGVWETDDAGRTWKPIFDGQPIGSIGALAIAPSNPRVIYVGTGEADMRSDIAQGDGVYKSTDGGRSWTQIGLADTQQIGRILVDPRDPDRVLVAALGHPYGPNPERGVFRSEDGGPDLAEGPLPGRRHRRHRPGFPPGRPERRLRVALADAPSAVERLPAVERSGQRPLQVDRRREAPGRRSPATAFPRSTGASGSPSRRAGRTASTRWSTPAPGGRALSLGRRRCEPGAHVSGDRRIWGRGWYFGGVTVEPRDPDTVYAGNTALYRSRDGGRTFVPVKGAPGGDDYHQLWIDPEHPERRILATDQGAVVSLNGGETWSSWYNQPTGQMYHVITDTRFPYRVYGAQQDSGAAGIPSRTTIRDGINTMHLLEITAGGESDTVAPDPKDPEVVFGGRVEKLDLRTGQTYAIDPTLRYREVDRATWTLPLVFSRRDPRVLYFARQRLFRTEDGGQHWTVISPDLTREDPGVPANARPGHRRRRSAPPAPPRRDLRDRAVHPRRPRPVGGHRRRPGLAHARRGRALGERHAQRPSRPGPRSASSRPRTSTRRAPTPPSTAIASTTPGPTSIGPTTAAGAGRWPRAAFRTAASSTSCARTRCGAGLLYAGTEKGVYVSFDDGDHWQSLQLEPAGDLRARHRRARQTTS